VSVEVQLCAFADPLLNVPTALPPPKGQVEDPPGQNLIWSDPGTPDPMYEGSVLVMVNSNTLPSLERQPVPDEKATTLEAVFKKPDQGKHPPALGGAKPLPTKVVPPLPKPLFTEMQ